MTAINGSVGRPRSSPRRRAGATAREEILDAAAELFTGHGYAATSTRAIADAVGVKQASLYYHFPSKEQILFDLLLATVQPTLGAATSLAETGEPAPVQLWALAGYDVRLLCSGRWNLGALYHLPELRAARFAPFHAERHLLRAAYGTLVADGVADGTFVVADVDLATRVIFGFVESVISLRQEQNALDGDALAPTVADGCLQLLGCTRRAVVSARRRALALPPPRSLSAHVRPGG